MTVRSALYVGQLDHARGGSVRYRFRYPLAFAALDLAELDALVRRLRLLSRNRWNLYSFQDRDYVEGEQAGVDAAARRFLRERGIADPARIQLVTQLRVLGGLFNPVSFFYAYREGGDLSCVIAEVNNTYGQTHRYLLGPGEQVGPGPVYRTPKTFHVSPFLGPDLEYQWAFPSAARAGWTERHEVRVAVSRAGRPLFAARLAGTRHPLDDGTLLRAFARFPLAPVRTLALIHWQALILRLRGLQYRPPPDLVLRPRKKRCSEAGYRG